MRFAAVPVTAWHHGSKAFRDAVVIVIAEYIQRHLGSCHQIVGRAGLHHGSDACADIFHVEIAQCAVAQRTRADAEAVRIMLTHPSEEDILIASIVCGGVSLGCAGHFQHVGLVHEFGSVDVHAVGMAEIEDLLRLRQIKRAAVRMIARTIADGDQQLTAHRFHKIQHANPLLLRQHAGITFRRDAAGGSFKVIVGLGRP